MLAKDSGAGSNFDLPEDVLEVLPSDPFEQLDVARKITSIALSTRVSALESEASALRRQLSDKDATIADLHAQIESLDFSLSDVSEKLGRADDEKVGVTTSTFLPYTHTTLIQMCNLQAHLTFADYAVGEFVERERTAVQHCKKAQS
ncbi:hypothetical protein RJ639_044069 [Escallonia herrerae]|uniref:Uncharacterized protein n=1 Tax=Escallonia herrerae TaxID=1293975 RepID=A0AA88WDV6_9ASTE|nr:hypothetical protein RJ639_044069 [Escallonia herrerae]